MPRRPSGPSLPGSPWGPTGPVLPGGPWVPVVPYKAADKTKVDLKKKKKDFDRTHHATQLPLLPWCLASPLFLRCPRDPAADRGEAAEMVVKHIWVWLTLKPTYTQCAENWAHPSTRRSRGTWLSGGSWRALHSRTRNGEERSGKNSNKNNILSKKFRHYAEYYVIHIHRGLKTSYCFSSFSSVSLGPLYTICSLQVRKCGIN